MRIDAARITEVFMREEECILQMKDIHERTQQAVQENRERNLGSEVRSATGKVRELELEIRNVRNRQMGLIGWLIGTWILHLVHLIFFH